MEIRPLTCYVPDWLKCMISLAPFRGRCLFAWCLLHDPVEVPAIGDAFQYVLPGVLEGEPAARDEVDDRSRHKGLTRAGLRRDARANVNGDPRDVVASELRREPPG
jgi:hypothetical protein